MIKKIAGFLVLSLLVEQVSFAAPAVSPVSLDIFAKPAVSLRFSDAVAQIEDVHQTADGKTLLLIQDAHTNASAQFNIAKTLETLTEQDSDFKLIFLEAAFGSDSLSFIRERTHEQKIKAESFVRQGLFDGAEYFDLNTDKQVLLWGVEDKALYEKALASYKDVAANREKFLSYLSRVEQASESLKPFIYGPSLKSFDALHSRHLKEELALTEYFSELSTFARKNGIELSRYPHLKALNSLKAKEAAIDFEKANAEQAAAIASLPETDQKELTELAKTPSKLMGAQKEARAFYSVLKDKLAVSDKHPELAKYFEYLDAAKKIETKEVLAEQAKLEDELFAVLAKTEDERRLILTSRNTPLLKKLFSLTLTPEEFEAYEKNAAAFDITRLTGFLNKKIMDLGSQYERVSFLETGYDETVRQAETFYRIAHERNEAFLEELIRKMDEEGQSKAVLITGGFHTPDLKALLKANNISYISVTPQVLAETNLKKYEELLLSRAGGETRLAVGPRQSANAMDVLAGGQDAGIVSRFAGKPVDLNTRATSLIGARLASKKPADKKKIARDALMKAAAAPLPYHRRSTRERMLENMGPEDREAFLRHETVTNAGRQLLKGIGDIRREFGVGRKEARDIQTGRGRAGTERQKEKDGARLAQVVDLSDKSESDAAGLMQNGIRKGQKVRIIDRRGTLHDWTFDAVVEREGVPLVQGFDKSGKRSSLFVSEVAGYQIGARLADILTVAQYVTVERGAFTGQVHIDDALKAGADAVLIRHSETIPGATQTSIRDTDELVSSKIKGALSRTAVRSVIVAFGEEQWHDLSEGSSGIFALREVLSRQILTSLHGVAYDARLVIAYEPRWAIGGSGQGKAADPVSAQAAHRMIREILRSQFGDNADKVRIIYGGSVKADNIASYLAQPDIDGALVGGASADTAKFRPIVEKAAEAASGRVQAYGRKVFIGGNQKAYEVIQELKAFEADLKPYKDAVDVAIAPTAPRIHEAAAAFHPKSDGARLADQSVLDLIHMKLTDPQQRVGLRYLIGEAIDHLKASKFGEGVIANFRDVLVPGIIREESSYEVMFTRIRSLAEEITGKKMSIEPARGARLAADAELDGLMRDELTRQQNTLNLVPSMTHTPPHVLIPLSAALRRRAGIEVRKLAEQRWYRVFSRVYQNPRASIEDEYGIAFAHSGSQSNQIADWALTPGSKVMGMRLDHGGHLTHGYGKNQSGIFFEMVPKSGSPDINDGYGVDQKTGEIDYDQLEKYALEYRPAKIVAGSTAYPGQIDWVRLRAIADKVGALLHADIAHNTSQVVVGEYPSPFGIADIITMTTQKSQGPRSGLVFARRAGGLYERIRAGAEGGIQEEPMWNAIAAQAAQAHWMMSPEADRYGKNIGVLMQAFVKKAQALGIPFSIPAGSRNHLALVNVFKKYGILGSEAQELLEKMGLEEYVGLGANANTIPLDDAEQQGLHKDLKQTPLRGHGIRVGAPSMAARGFTAADAEQVAELFDRILKNVTITRNEVPGKKPGETIIQSKIEIKDTAERDAIMAEIRKLTAARPIPDFELYMQVLEGDPGPAWERLRERDPQLYQVLKELRAEQASRIDLAPTAAEVADEVADAAAFAGSDVYAEGDAGTADDAGIVTRDPRRYYPMNGINDRIERRAIRLWEELFGVRGRYEASVQPNSHAQAVQIGLVSVANPDDEIIILRTGPDGYRSHGPESFVMRAYKNARIINVDASSEASVRAALAGTDAKVILYSASDIDSSLLRRLTAPDTVLFADLGADTFSVLGGTVAFPAPDADLIAVDTRAAGGFTGGVLFASTRVVPSVNARVKAPKSQSLAVLMHRRGVIPGVQGGPLLHIIASKARQAKWLSEQGRAIARRTRKLEEELIRSLALQGITARTREDGKLGIDLPAGLERARAQQLLENLGIDTLDDAWTDEPASGTLILSLVTMAQRRATAEDVFELASRIGETFDRARTGARLAVKELSAEDIARLRTGPLAADADAWARVQDARWYQVNLDKLGIERAADAMPDNAVVLDNSAGAAAGSLRLAQHMKARGKRIKTLYLTDVGFDLARAYLAKGFELLKPYVEDGTIGEIRPFILEFDKTTKAYAPLTEVPGLTGSADLAMFLNAIHLVGPNQRESAFAGLAAAMKPGRPVLIGSGGLDPASLAEVERGTIHIDTLFTKVAERALKLAQEDASFADIRRALEALTPEQKHEAQRSRNGFVQTAPVLAEVEGALRKAGFGIERALSTTRYERNDGRNFIVGDARGRIEFYIERNFRELVLAGVSKERRNALIEAAYDKYFDENASNDALSMQWTSLVLRTENLLDNTLIRHITARAPAAMQAQRSRALEAFLKRDDAMKREIFARIDALSPDEVLARAQSAFGAPARQLALRPSSGFDDVDRVLFDESQIDKPLGLMVSPRRNIERAYLLIKAVGELSRRMEREALIRDEDIEAHTQYLKRLLLEDDLLADTRENKTALALIAMNLLSTVDLFEAGRTPAASESLARFRSVLYGLKQNPRWSEALRSADTGARLASKATASLAPARLGEHDASADALVAGARLADETSARSGERMIAAYERLRDVGLTPDEIRVRKAVAAYANKLAPHVQRLEDSNHIEDVQAVLDQMAKDTLWEGGPSLVDGQLPPVSSALINLGLSLPPSSHAFGLIYDVWKGLTAHPLIQYATPAQKEKYLKPLLAAQQRASFGLTSPESGSASYDTAANVVFDASGENGVLNGTKVYQTVGMLADFVIVFARTHPDPLARPTERNTAFIVPIKDAEGKYLPGITVTHEKHMMGHRGTGTATISFTDVKVTKSDILGKLGQGHEISMNVLDTGRIALGSMIVASLETSFEEVARHYERMKARGASKQVLDEVEMVANGLKADAFSARQLLIETARQKERGEDFKLYASLINIMAIDSVMNASEALRAIGPEAAVLGERMEREIRDAKLFEIGEGTNEVQRFVVSKYLEKLGNKDYFQGVSAYINSLPQTKGLGPLKVRLVILLNEFLSFSKYEKKLIMSSFASAMSDSVVVTRPDTKKSNERDYVIGGIKRRIADIITIAEGLKLVEKAYQADQANNGLFLVYSSASNRARGRAEILAREERGEISRNRNEQAVLQKGSELAAQLNGRLTGISEAYQYLSMTDSEALLGEGELGGIAIYEASTDAPTRAAPQADGSYRITGRKIFAANSADPDIEQFFVIANVEGSGPTAFLVKRGPSVSINTPQILGLRDAKLADITFTDAPATLLGEPGGADVYLQKIVRVHREVLGSLLVPAARRLIADGREYALNVRQQPSGVPIANYALVIELLDDANRLADGLPVSADPAGDFFLIAKNVLQVFGGIGYSEESAEPNTKPAVAYRDAAVLIALEGELARMAQTGARLAGGATDIGGNFAFYGTDDRESARFDAVFGPSRPGTRNLILTEGGAAFALAREDVARQTLYIRPEAAGLTLTTLGYLHALVQRTGRLVEWVDMSGSPAEVDRVLRGIDSEYRISGSHPRNFQQPFAAGPLIGERYRLGRDQLFQLRFTDRRTAGPSARTVLTEKSFTDPVTGLRRRSYVAMPEKTLMFAGMGTINAQNLHFARDLGILVKATNRNPDNTLYTFDDGADMYLLDAQYKEAYERAGYPTRGTLADAIRDKAMDGIVDGFDGEVTVPKISGAAGETEVISVSEYWRRGLLGDAVKQGIWTLYQGGSDAAIADGYMNPFILEMLGLSLEAAHDGQLENQCFSCNGTSMLSLLATLERFADRIDSASIAVTFIRRGKDFPEVDFTEKAIQSTSKPAKHHHTDEDIQGYLKRLKETLPAPLKSKVNFSYLEKADGSPAFRTEQRNGLQSFYHKVVVTIKVRLTDGSVLNADAFRDMAKKAPNLAVADLSGMLLLNAEGTAAVDLDDKVVGRLTKHIVNDLGVDRPALTPLVAQDLPDGSGFAVGALTFQKHNVVPANLALYLLKLGLVADAAEANRRAMEIMGMDVLKSKIETGRFGDKKKRPGSGARLSVVRLTPENMSEYLSGILDIDAEYVEKYNRERNKVGRGTESFERTSVEDLNKELEIDRERLSRVYVEDGQVLGFLIAIYNSHDNVVEIHDLRRSLSAPDKKIGRALLRSMAEDALKMRKKPLIAQFSYSPRVEEEISGLRALGFTPMSGSVRGTKGWQQELAGMLDDSQTSTIALTDGVYPLAGSFISALTAGISELYKEPSPQHGRLDEASVRSILRTDREGLSRVYVENNEVIGFVLAHVSALNTAEISLRDIYVSAPAQDRGLRGHLLEELKIAARQLRPVPTTIEVVANSADGPRVSYLMSLGFNPAGLGEPVDGSLQLSVPVAADQRTGGARLSEELSQFFTALAERVGPLGSRLALADVPAEGRTSVFTLLKKGSDIVAEAEYLAEPIRLDLKAQQAQRAAENLDRELDEPSSAGLLSLENSLVQAITNRLLESDILLADQVIVDYRDVEISPEDMELYAPILAAEIVRASRERYGRGASFIVPDAVKDAIEAMVSEGLKLRPGLLLTPADANALERSGVRRVRFATARSGFDAKAVNILSRELVADRGTGKAEAPNFRAKLIIALYAGSVDLARIPTGFLNAWSTAAGIPVSEATLRGILAGTLSVEEALRFALKPLTEPIDFNTVLRAIEMTRRNVLRSA